MREMLSEHREILKTISKNASQIYPLEERKSVAVEEPITAVSLCSSIPNDNSTYRVTRGEKVSVSAKLGSDWTVKSSDGKLGKVPSIILTIQPPSKDALDFAKRFEFINYSQTKFVAIIFVLLVFFSY